MTDPAPEPQPTEPQPTEPTEPTEPTPGEVAPDHGDEGEEAEQEGEPAEAQPPAGEPPPEQPPTEAMSEADREKLSQSLEKERDRHARRIGDLVGEDANHLVMCELCEPLFPGFHWPADLTQPRDPVHERLLAALTMPAKPEYVFDANQPACQKCEGWGQVATGSKVPNHQSHICPRCKGTGVEPSAGQMQNGPAEPAPVLAAVGPPEDQPPPADADPWGSPRLLETGQENPNYGKMPQYKSPEFP